MTRDYGPGFNTPLLVTADIIRTTDPIGVMKKLGKDIEKYDGVDAVALSTPNRTADLGMVQIVPSKAQTDPATAELVRDIRADSGKLEKKYDITDLRVTGQTAVTIDVSDRLFGALLPFGIVVVGLSLLLLMVVFRSIAVPIKATLGYLLSVGASFGVVTAVFEWGWFADAINVPNTGPVISFMPIILMGVLFGLAMDYEVFLVSRMREEYVHTGNARQSVLTGFTGSARVVTAAAIIMISVFAAFVPHGDASVQPIAFGLAVGVFVDAFLVRMTLVPAVLAMLGSWAWWLPEWLDRRLPSLDVEGSGIAKHVEHDEWVAEHGRPVVRAERLSLPADGEPLLQDVNLVVWPGELLVVKDRDHVRRRAFLAALTGRVEHGDGRLVVLDRVLPAESQAVRRRVALHHRLPAPDELDQLARRAGEGIHTLLVVDDLDGADESATEERWDRLRDLTLDGVTVIAGSAGDVPAGASVLDLAHHTHNAEHTHEKTPEEATV